MNQSSSLAPYKDGDAEAKPASSKDELFQAEAVVGLIVQLRHSASETKRTACESRIIELSVPLIRFIVNRSAWHHSFGQETIDRLDLIHHCVGYVPRIIRGIEDAPKGRRLFNYFCRSIENLLTNYRQKSLNRQKYVILPDDPETDLGDAPSNGYHGISEDLIEKLNAIPISMRSFELFGDARHTLAIDYIANLSLDGSPVFTLLSRALANQHPDIPVRLREPLIKSVIACVRWHLRDLRPSGLSDETILKRVRNNIPEIWPLVDMLPKDQAADIVYVLRGLVSLIPENVVEV